MIKSYPGLAIGSKGKIVPDGNHDVYFIIEPSFWNSHSQPGRGFLQHVDCCCLKYMNKVLSPQLNAFSTNVEHNTDQPGLQYQDLRMVFKPGTLLYKNARFPRIVQLHRVEWVVQRFPPPGPPPSSGTIESYWILHSKRLCFSGRDLEITNFTHRLAPYEGVRSFSSLDIFPLEYHERYAQIRQESLDRVKLFISKAVGLRYCHYEGTGLIINQNNIQDRYEYQAEPTEINERIVLDEMPYSEYRRQNLREPPKSMTRSTLVPADDLTTLSRLKDDELRTCQVLIGGYVLGMEKWGAFHIDFIRDVNFSRYAFDSLALSLEMKSLIAALVTSHTPPPASANIVMKKGRGLTFLLHGPPGVGKTITAESIADYMKRPLYRLNSSTVMDEEKLLPALSNAQKWDAIVLMDEADVFMQRRDSHNINHNNSVSMLLRHLEYFGGILFLTTNRVHTIDEAFKSRIHLSVSYPHLSLESKQRLWEQGLTRAQNDKKKPQWLTPQLLKILGKHNTNGREIDNLIYMARTMARNEGRDMEREDVLRGLNSLQTFNKDISSEANRSRGKWWDWFWS